MMFDLFEAFKHFSGVIHAEDARQKRVAALRSQSSRKCGNCEHWMKSNACPRETNTNGRRNGPSMSAAACGKFLPTRDAIAAKQALAQEEGKQP